MTATLTAKRHVSRQQPHLLSQQLLLQALLPRKLQPRAHSLQLHRQLQVKLHQALGLGLTPCCSSPMLLRVLVGEGQGVGGAAEGEGPKEGKGGEEAGQSSEVDDSCTSPFQLLLNAHCWSSLSAVT